MPPSETCRPLTLTDGSITWVDNQDYAVLRTFRWLPHSKGYVLRSNGRRGSTVMMHAQITGVRGSDHRNGNRRDNRRANLRVATGSQNQANRGKQRGQYSSRYKGVSWYKRDRLWRVQVGTGRHVGYYADEIEAARAYDHAAFALWGEFAQLNFQEDR